MRCSGCLPLVCALFLLLPPPARSQETDETAAAEKPAFAPFPLALALDRALSGRVDWQPDWPAELPADCFRAGPAGMRGVSVETPAGVFRAAWDGEGRLVELPVPLNGALVQVQAAWNGAGGVRALSSPDWEAETLEYSGQYPVKLRIHADGAWFFAAIAPGDRERTETWFDEGGAALAVYEYALSAQDGVSRIRAMSARSAAPSDGGEAAAAAETVIHYESRGLVSAVENGAAFQALYSGDGLPRYWRLSADDTRYSFQWDAAGSLVSLRRESAADGAAEFRYEYTRDTRGAWIERREIRLEPGLGGLVPGGGAVVKRRIEYGD
ncbi:MAG: hypothetical protein MdMp014T_0071 [Treponematales bacterium]